MIRKHIAVLGAALLLVAAGDAAAQSKAPTDTARRQGEFRRGDRGRGPRGDKMGRGGMKSLFRGIDLTQSQRDQMKVVSEKYGAQYRTLRESLKPDLKAAHEARQRGDTVAARAAWERTSADRERMRTLMEQQKNEVRALLTPEQQKTFDANATKMRDHFEKRAVGRGQRAKGQGPRGRKGDAA
jgi:Spy/CpxP family protein refolding chaperone